MKTLSLLHTKAAAVVMGLLLITAACGEIDDAKKDVVPEGHGILTVNVKSVDTPTKSYTAAIGGDMTARGLQVLIFDERGNFYDAATKDSDTKYSKTVPTGTYTVVAVANGKTYNDSNAPTLSTLEAEAMSFVSGSGVNAEAVASGMARYGKGEATVTANGGTANVTAKIMAFRVTLAAANITGDAVGRLTLTDVFLENIYGNCTLGGTVSNFQNIGGRTGYAASSVPEVISANTAFGGAMTYNTFAAANNHGKGFYSYPKAPAADQFNGPLSENEAYTRLVLVGTWKQSASSASETVYCPVTIRHDSGAPQAGYSYDVTANITKKGSDDPNKPVPAGGGLTVNVDVNGWTAGPDITENF